MVLDLSFQIWWMICKQEFLGSKKNVLPPVQQNASKTQKWYNVTSIHRYDRTYHSRYQLHLEQSVEPGRTIRSTGRRLTWLWSFRIQSSCWLLLEVFSLISILKHHEFLINIYIYIYRHSLFTKNCEKSVGLNIKTNIMSNYNLRKSAGVYV